LAADGQWQEFRQIKSRQWGPENFEKFLPPQADRRHTASGKRGSEYIRPDPLTSIARHDVAARVEACMGGGIPVNRDALPKIQAPAISAGRASVRQTCFRDQHRIIAIKLGEQAFQIGDLRQVVIDDIGVGGVQRQEVLMIGFCRIEAAARLDLGDDGRMIELRLIELRNISAGNFRPSLTGKTADRYCVPRSGPWRLSWVGSCATEK
jgi:hypothetical protein